MRWQLTRRTAFAEVSDVAQLLQSSEDASFPALAAGPYPKPEGVFYNRFAMPKDYDRSWAPFNANPDMWETIYPRPMPAGYIHVLHGAMVYGGLIRDRSSRPYGHSHAPGQVMVSRTGELLPASFGVMDGVASLPHDLIEEVDKALVLTSDAEVTELAGTYLFLGQAHIHFGHFLVEGLARLWALVMLPEPLRSQIKVLVYEPELRPFAYALLSRMGIGRDRIVHAAPATRVERLIVADTAMQTHHWIRPEMAWVWDQIAGPAPLCGPDKVFLSRPPKGQRPVINLAQVEAEVESWGYKVVYPERHSIDEQIAFVRNAESVVSFAGSQSYLCGFQKPGGKNMILAPRNFFLVDDLLIAGVKGHETHVCFGSLVHTRRDEGWTCPLDVLAG